MIEIEQMLRSYLEDQARLKYLHLAVKELHHETDDIILSMGMAPRGGKNPTQYAALGYQNQLDRERSILQKEIVYLQRRVHRVNILLDSLTPRERLIIRAFYIYGESWDDVTARFEQEMPTGRCKSTLKTMRDQILKKLARILSVNTKDSVG